MKKKWFCFAVYALALVFLPACGEKQPTEEKESSVHSAKEEDGKITVAFSQAGEESEWRTAVTDSMKETFSGDDYRLLTEDAGTDQEQQSETVREWIDQDVDYLVISPLGNQVEEVLEEAKEAEIPVILVENQIEVSDDTLFSAWVGSDYLQQGYDAADWLLEYLEENGREGEAMNIAMTGSGSGAAEERFQGFSEQKELDHLDQWKLLEQDPEELLQSEEKIDAVVCGDDQTALEAIRAVENTGKKCGTDIIVISFGATKTGLEELESGRINADVECESDYGPYVKDIIDKLQKQEEVDKLQYMMEEKVLDAESLKENG